MLGEAWEENPTSLATPAWFDLVQTWRICRGGTGYALLPDAGGVNDQPAWTVDAFARLSRLEAEADERGRRAAG